MPAAAFILGAIVPNFCTTCAYGSGLKLAGHGNAGTHWQNLGCVAPLGHEYARHCSGCRHPTGPNRPIHSPVLKTVLLLPPRILEPSTAEIGTIAKPHVSVPQPFTSRSREPETDQELQDSIGFHRFLSLATSCSGYPLRSYTVLKCTIVYWNHPGCLLQCEIARLATKPAQLYQDDPNMNYHCSILQHIA